MMTGSRQKQRGFERKLKNCTVSSIAGSCRCAPMLFGRLMRRISWSTGCFANTGRPSVLWSLPALSYCAASCTWKAREARRDKRERKQFVRERERDTIRAEIITKLIPRPFFFATEDITLHKLIPQRIYVIGRKFQELDCVIGAKGSGVPEPQKGCPRQGGKASEGVSQDGYTGRRVKQAQRAHFRHFEGLLAFLAIATRKPCLCYKFQ